MSVGQANAQNSMSVNTPILHIQGTDLSVSNFMLDVSNHATNVTAMIWALHHNAFVNAYHDLIGVSDHGDAYGMSLLRVNDNSALFNLGDNLNDWTSGVTITNDVWHHYAFTVFQSGTRQAWGLGYVDGVLAIDTRWAAVTKYITTPIMTNRTAPPDGPAFVSISNTRASDTDGQACWVGNFCGVKIWDRVLTPAEIRREMPYYVPQMKEGIWTFSPMLALDLRTHNYAGRASVNWTSRGAWYSEGTNDPPGVLWDNPFRQSMFPFVEILRPTGPFPTFRPDLP